MGGAGIRKEMDPQQGGTVQRCAALLLFCGKMERMLDIWLESAILGLRKANFPSDRKEVLDEKPS